jgi:COP9 signalosome complex subunit 6
VNTGNPGVQVLGVLLGSQVGRTVDISNSFEIAYEQRPQGEVVIDQPFLVRKQEQCGWSF